MSQLAGTETLRDSPNCVSAHLEFDRSDALLTKEIVAIVVPDMLAPWSTINFEFEQHSSELKHVS